MTELQSSIEVAIEVANRAESGLLAGEMNYDFDGEPRVTGELLRVAFFYEEEARVSWCYWHKDQAAFFQAGDKTLTRRGRVFWDEKRRSYFVQRIGAGQMWPDLEDYQELMLYFGQPYWQWR